MTGKAKAAETRPALPVAAVAALGVVFGDLGTSPLYTLQAVVQATGGRFTPGAALGVLSLIVWALIITVSVKYCLFVMRADNKGEGGILALTSLVGGNALEGRARLLALAGLAGAALVYGDGVITPSISVLSALEGVKLRAPGLGPYVMPAAVAILALLFAGQGLGTSRIGGSFGPIMLLWFAVIAALGITGIIRHPEVAAAVDPLFAVRFLAHSGLAGFAVLGAVFLCITGGEALYADIGHFGKGPIRLGWYAVVLPALLLSYAGQTALLLQKGTIRGNPFFQLAPPWALYPLVGLATVATIIASQAIITGAFSMTRQAIQLGWLPGAVIRQTSDKVYGQIYVPVVNWLMMAATIAITVGFRSSDRLAGAYGTAVSTTMLLTSILLFTAMRKVWRWPLAGVLLASGVFMAVDFAFFSANLLKIAEGGWLPLTLAIVLFLVMIIWRGGVDAVHAVTSRASETPARFWKNLETGKTPRVQGVAIFMTRSRQNIPPLMIDHVRHMGSLHARVICLTVAFEEAPRIPEADRGAVEMLAEDICRVTVRFGFVEIPDIPQALKRLQAGDVLDRDIDIDKAVYFAARDLVIPRRGSTPLQRWRLHLFGFLFRNAVKTIDSFRLPPRQVVEIAREIEV